MVSCENQELGPSQMQELEANRGRVSVSILDALNSYLRIEANGQKRDFLSGSRACTWLSTGGTFAERLVSLNAQEAARSLDHLIYSMA